MSFAKTMHLAFLFRRDDIEALATAIAEAVKVYRLVDPQGELVRAARAVGIEFG